MQIEELYSIFKEHPSVSTDTRKLQKNSIFFALKGENFNANEFAEKAIEAGCSFAVIDEEKYQKDSRFILVEDVLQTLQQLANYHRKQFKIPFIGITGSNGKTTTKELIAAVLSKDYSTYYTQGNLNNHIGVPLTLLAVNATHEMAVIEMGANHQGEIKLLCSIAEPDYGIITNIGKAHIEGFGGFEGIKKGKGELYQFIKNRTGKLFINNDNSILTEMLNSYDAIGYGTSSENFVSGLFIESNPFVKFKWKSDKEKSFDEQPLISSHLVGKYNFENILSAICVGKYFGIDEQKINEAIENYIPNNNRSQAVEKNSNMLILDYYNANPTSMKAAIENFAEMNAATKMLVLGDMLELGEESAFEHQNIIELLHTKKLINVILVGPLFNSTKSDCKKFISSEEAANYIKLSIPQNTSILIKGSRGIKLEKVVEVL